MDLFDHANRQAASRAARDEGMQRVEQNATQEWCDLMLDFVRLTCLEAPRFTSDDVFDRLDAHPDAPQTHDLRAFGPVMMRAARLGYCKKADVAAVPSRRPSLHASPRAVWDSLIFQRD